MARRGWNRGFAFLGFRVLTSHCELDLIKTESAREFERLVGMLKVVSRLQV
ncbi:MAG: hypothetical protein QOJ40_2448 [Verrucomicrobiota bacterium]